jgi:hypothetical protein
MPASDRRCNPRFLLVVPVRFQHPAGGEITTQALNVSRSGLFLKCTQKLAIGTSLHMRIRVPREISGSVFSELRCTGRVVHECYTQGEIGYGIEIDGIPAAVRPLPGSQPLAARL